VNVRRTVRPAENSGIAALEQLEPRRLLNASPADVGNGNIVSFGGSSLRVGNRPVFIAQADFNNDGKPDIATLNYGSNTISVLLSNGDGTFQPQIVSPAGGSSTLGKLIGVGDFNGDGKIDIVSANTIDSVESTVNIVLGNGDGTFGPATSFDCAYRPDSLSVADINGDGNLDVVTTSLSGSISILLGNGQGGFAPQQQFSVNSPKLYTLTTADLLGDGHPDLIAGTANSSLIVYLNKGNGTFDDPITLNVGNHPDSIAVADINGDGRPDIVACNYSDGTISSILSKGYGQFYATQFFDIGNRPTFVTVADFTGDGKPDVLTDNIGILGVTFLIGNGDGTFLPQETIYPGSDTYTAAVGDFNGDGKPDAILSKSQSGYGGTGTYGNVLFELLNLTTPNTASATGSSSGDMATAGIDKNGQVSLLVNGQGESFPMGSVGSLDISLGGGADTFMAGAGLPQVSVSGGGGKDMLINAGNSSATLSGGGGNDTVVGGDAASMLMGGAGNDVFFNAGNGDTINGGAGLNFSQYNPNDSMKNIFEVFDAPAPPATPAAVSAAAAAALAPAADSIVASLNGTELLVQGTSGADTIIVGLDAMSANLQVSVDGSIVNTYPLDEVASIRINGFSGPDFIAVNSNVLLPATLLGGGGADTLVGGGSDNVLIGGGNGDSLVGGSGTNLLIPALKDFYDSAPRGSDTLDGGAGYSIADFSHRTDRLNLSNDGVADSGDLGDGEHSQINSNISAIWGGTSADTINGTTAGLFISGGFGADSINSGGANNVIVGGLGKDTVFASVEPVALYLNDGKRDRYGGISNPIEDILELDSKDRSL